MKRRYNYKPKDKTYTNNNYDRIRQGERERSTLVQHKLKLSVRQSESKFWSGFQISPSPPEASSHRRRTSCPSRCSSSNTSASPPRIRRPERRGLKITRIIWIIPNIIQTLKNNLAKHIKRETENSFQLSHWQCHISTNHTTMKILKNRVKTSHETNLPIDNP